jgi:hypothetical protein
LGQDGNIPAGRDVLSHAKAEKQTLEESEREIRELQIADAKLQREKLDLQAQCAILLEKVRQTDQDRTMVSNAVESERAKLSALLKERATLLEERLQRSTQMTALSAQAWAQHGSPVPGAMQTAHGIRPSTAPLHQTRGHAWDKGIPITENAPAQAVPGANWVSFGGGQQAAPVLDVDKFPLSRPRGDGGSGVGFEDRSHGGDVVGRGRREAHGDERFSTGRRKDAFENDRYKDVFGDDDFAVKDRKKDPSGDDGFSGKDRRKDAFGDDGFSMKEGRKKAFGDDTFSPKDSQFGAGEDTFGGSRAGRKKKEKDDFADDGFERGSDFGSRGKKDSDFGSRGKKDPFGDDAFGGSKFADDFMASPAFGVA